MQTTTKPTAPVPTAAPPTAPARLPTLLVVDDDESPRLALQMVFQNEFEVLLACDGAQALALAEHRPVDVAVLDLRLQGMHGIEVAERLKTLDADIQIIILTAYESVETARQAIRLGACDYLPKPFDLDLVRVAVTDALSRREQLRRLRALEEEIQHQKLEGEIARTKDEIYASILHDINGPLTFISGVTEMLYHDFPEISDLELANLDFIKEQLGHVSRQANRCIELSRRYLSYLSGSATGQVCIDLAQVFTDVEKLLKFYPVAWDNQLLVHLPEEELFLQANGIHVIQILLNLTVNALQATSAPHTVDISARRLDRPLAAEELGCSPTCRVVNLEGFPNQPPLVAITVRDDGPGIPPEILPKIFEPFFTTQAPKLGRGLGLSIVLRCLRQNKGALRLSSAPGAGTTVTVYLGLGQSPVA